MNAQALMDQNRLLAQKVRTMWVILILSCLLSLSKFVAWHLTNSNAIFTDALESIINLVAGGFALYSIYFASKPKDADHPYGHGKIEFISAGFEGALISVAGIWILFKSLQGFFIHPPIQQLDIGLMLVGLGSVCNYFMGSFLTKSGRKHDSAVMIAEGKHLLTDTISGLGLIAGLLLIRITHILWLDNVIALLYGSLILRTGYKMMKSSVGDLLDEADFEKLDQVITLLNKKRRDKWIDIHKLRVLKYGAQLHIDCHITLPWYESLEDTHSEVSILEQLIKEDFQGEVEFFIHSDPCIPSSCPICVIANCKVRQLPFTGKLNWTIENMLPDKKHTRTEDGTEHIKTDN
jgi:cation diffusion facilitator family transporter